MYQQLTIVGNLGSDPELRYTADGTPVANFNVAVNRRWTGQDGKPGEETTWFRVTAWRKLAEVCNQYLRKGRQVLVVGRISASAYLAADGKPRATLDFTATDIKFMSGGRSESSPFAEEASETPQEEDFF